MSGREAGGETAAPVEFAAAPFDMVEGLCGDPRADLVVFFAGNQYMVVPDLVDGYLATHPSVGSVFYETLPPGVVAAQPRAGGLRMGSLVLRVHPDVMASSPAALAELEREGLVGPARSYASNDLALLVAAGNPTGVGGWTDLGRPGVRVAFPDPRTEGIGRLALDCVEASGGAALRQRVEVDKAAGGEVVFTSIHHRQGPAWLEGGATDVAVAWTTEARYHLERGGPFEMIALPEVENRRGVYAAGVVTGAVHQEAAGWFVDYLCGQAGWAAYAAHGFSVAG
jgi:molybdate transport system substrate-binding protein